MRCLWQILAALLLFALQGSCACHSYGWDYVDGGTYCVNTKSDEYFSFGTGFWGCTPNDTQGGVEPILVDPDSNDVLCSVIQTNPDDVNMVSTCDIVGHEIRKSQMVSGKWSVVIEGLEFAWMRSFSVIAGPQVTKIATPTITINQTMSPSTTVTVVTTNTLPTTLSPSTITIPSTTSTATSTVTPKTVTTTITKVRTITLPAWPPKVTKTTVTRTQTTACKTASRRNDPTCTVHPPKASLAAAGGSYGRFRRHAPYVPRAPPTQHLNDLGRRTPDLCTTTVLASTVVTSTSTITAPTTTISSTLVETATKTMWVDPGHTCSGDRLFGSCTDDNYHDLAYANGDADHF
ncbi:uncharacterized protein HMPREF1541_07342 [Cyphellophora europaea CBS 101466]|uniref:Uncharacterized protein n=1 Tax=Cyphellophora europaea (strain CBS 101466) TaxID=1220924 RepID=W2RPR1_CYPE1|nr:uncharacterized protein HMPREF1541_07342 [Cyphellophora europaea CBS 101466]ETN37719.1 hypothetical protein HMPREF1541_07342 [Cyphellophora europaea CBS 101466]